MRYRKLYTIANLRVACPMPSRWHLEVSPWNDPPNQGGRWWREPQGALHHHSSYNKGGLIHLYRSAAILLSAVLTLHGAEPVDFTRDVRPILSDKCFTCHGPDESKRLSGLRFDTEAGAFGKVAGGGYAIVRGDPDQSALIARVSSSDEARRMPPAAMGHAPLSADEIATLTAWVREGATWEQHWSYLAPRKAPAPATASNWGYNAIDRFVLKRLEQEGISPSEAAERTTLIRRASLDLTGLPPTPEQVRSFVHDGSPDAFEKVLDRLLTSPRYAERMAFRWLDAARYADTNGYQNDEERDMWRWRDWVIEAFDRNMPFDQFTIEQLAGDLLPNATLAQKIATGFNRNHRGNAENGTDPDEYQVEYAVDRLDATATIWLGMTMGCARCHDHKYDPIRQKEFYEFYAYFNNVSDRGRYYKFGNTPPIVHAPTTGQQENLDALDSAILETEQRLAALSEEISRGLDSIDPRKISDWTFDERIVARQTFDATDRGAEGVFGRAAYLDGDRHYDLGDLGDYDFYDPFTVSAWIKPETSTGGIIARYLPTPRGYGLFLVDGKLQLRVDTTSISDRTRIESVDEIPLNDWTHVAGTYDGSRKASGMKLYINGRLADAHTLIDESLNSTKVTAPLRVGFGPGKDDRFHGSIDEARLYSRPLSTKQVGVIAVAETPAEIAKLAPGARSEAQQRKLRWAYISSGSSKGASDVWSDLSRLRLEHEDFVRTLPTVMVMDEREDVRPTHILYRGSFDAPRERVDPSLPSALPPMPAGLPNNRLGLARWLTDPTHPLTARVTVNRFWQMLFGRGIVSTVEDFGSQGAAPSHPEMLDWLAVDFIENGWDIKHLLKTIMLSATYQQSSKQDPELLVRDPENVLLARAPRLRLPAEAIRDQALEVAGLLTAQTGGPSVRPYQPDGLWKELSNWDAYQNDHGDDLYRRSLYTFWKRTLGPPAMLAFDSADRESCVVLETRTNTPIQALNLMNDVTYGEASRLFAERMIREGGEQAGERLAYGFELATARQPAESEKEILLRGLRRYEDRYRTTPTDADKLLAQGEYPRDESLDAPELAAYTAVASMILNLDETITRE